MLQFWKFKNNQFYHLKNYTIVQIIYELWKNKFNNETIE